MGRSSGLSLRVACLLTEAFPARMVSEPRRELSLTSMTAVLTNSSRGSRYYCHLGDDGLTGAPSITSLWRREPDDFRKNWYSPRHDLIRTCRRAVWKRLKSPMTLWTRASRRAPLTST